MSGRSSALEFLSSEQCLALDRGYLVTVNVQHIYEARQSHAVADAVFADPGACHCLDGRGAVALFRRTLPKARLPLVQGNELLENWLVNAPQGARLLVIGSNAATVHNVIQRFPQIVVEIDDAMVSVTSPADALLCADELAQRHPGSWTMIALALGVPKQELLAQALQHRFAVPIYCIGGSFEILADALPRSPQWAQAIGLEGVWRLLLEPSRKRVERLFRTYATFAALRFCRPSLAQLTGRA